MIGNRWKYLGWSISDSIFHLWDYNEDNMTPVKGVRFLGFQFEKCLVPVRNWEVVDIRKELKAGKTAEQILSGWYLVYNLDTQSFQCLKAYPNIKDRLVFSNMLYSETEWNTIFWNDKHINPKRWVWYGPIAEPGIASFAFYQDK